MSATIYVHPITGKDPNRLQILQAFTGRVAVPVGAVVHLVPRLYLVPNHHPGSNRNDH